MNEKLTVDTMEGQPAEHHAVDDDVPELAEVLMQLPKDTPPEAIRIISEHWSYAGFAPTPSWVEKYEQVLPGTTDRIMGFSEREQEIRKRDNSGVLMNDRLRVLGSVVVSLSLIGGGVFCVIIGQPAAGIAIATSGAIAGAIKAFSGQGR